MVGKPGLAGQLGIMLDVGASPVRRDVVLAAASDDTRVPSQSKHGIYWSGECGDRWRLVHQFRCDQSQEAEPVGQTVFAPDDLRVYAAGGCAIALRRNGGRRWKEQSNT